MATHSMVWIEKDNEYNGIYVHNNGDPDILGEILLQHYNTFEKVYELIQLGDCSYIDEKVKPEPDEEHSFDKPASNVTVAYHRDRGEEYHMSIAYSIANCLREEYTYIFEDGSWRAFDYKREIDL